MRVVLLTGEYPPQPGGVGDYTCQLAAALRARGHEVAAITIQGGDLTVFRGDGCDPLRQPVAGLNWSHRAWPAVIGALDALRPDWLHIQYQTGAYAMSPGINFLPWRLLGLGAGRPRLAVTFHDLLVPYLFPKAGPLRTWVNLQLARSADAVVVTNSADAERLQDLAVRQRLTPHTSHLTPHTSHLTPHTSHLTPHTSHLAPHTSHLAPRTSRLAPHIIPIGSNIPVAPPPGYDRDAWRARLDVAPGELLVAYFGLLSYSKGADLLVESLARLDQPWRLLLVGGAATAPQDIGYAEGVHARLAAPGLSARVITTGHVPDWEVSAHLLAADCVALPFRDGASFRRGSLLAALAHGCPVVTTIPADPATADALSPAALLVSPGDATALHAALARLAAAPALRAELAGMGRALAARFSWETIAEQHERLYWV